MPSPSGPTGWSSLWLPEPGCPRLQEPRGKPGVPHRSQFQTQALSRRAGRRPQERWLVPHAFIPSTSACELYIVKDLHAARRSWPAPVAAPAGSGLGQVYGVRPSNCVHATKCTHLLAWDPTLGLPMIPFCQRPAHPLVRWAAPSPLHRASPCTLLSPSSWLLPPDTDVITQPPALESLTGLCSPSQRDALKGCPYRLLHAFPSILPEPTPLGLLVPAAPPKQLSRAQQLLPPIPWPCLVLLSQQLSAQVTTPSFTKCLLLLVPWSHTMVPLLPSPLHCLSLLRLFCWHQPLLD